MRRLYWLCILSAITAGFLALAAAYHYSFLRDTAKDSIDFIEHQFIDGKRLDQEQQRQLKRAEMRIEGGEKYLRNLHIRLWWISVLGFSLFSILFSLIASSLLKIDKSRTAEDDDRRS